jgi:hypothetical protein
MSRRLLYLDARRLTAYLWQAGALAQEAVFELTDDEQQRFKTYLLAHPGCQFRLLANVSEEGYQLESIPFLRGADRETVITRKASQYFQGTPLVLVTSLGYEKDKRKNEKLLFSALTNPAHFAPWLDAIEAADIALSGIYSTAQLGGVLLQKLRVPAGRCLLLTQQDQSIRESYLVNGQTYFSRMAPLVDSSVAGIAAGFAAEATKLHQYLISQRLLSRHDALPVYVLAHPQAIPAIRDRCQDSGTLLFDVSDSQQLAKQLALKTPLNDSRSDLLFLQLLATSPPKQQFANPVHRHDYRIAQIRYGLLVFGSLALLGGTLFSADEFFKTYTLNQETQDLIARSAGLELRYREIASTFPQIGVDNDSLRRVTTRHGELVAQQRLPHNAYHLIASALNQSPAIVLESLDWRISEAGKEDSNRPTSSLKIGNEIVIVRGLITLESATTVRQTLAELERFVQLLAVDRQYQVEIIQQPFDVDSNQALRGGDKNESTSKPRPFAVQITRRLAP